MNQTKLNSYKNQKVNKQSQLAMQSTQSTEQHKQKNLPKGNILHVANIHPQLNYQQIKQGLYNLFSVHGPIYDITIKTKQNGSHFAFVDYPDIKNAQKAWIASKKQGKILQNQELMVNYCEDPKKNEARKGAKCFLCHGIGHKAKNCTVRPQLIKPSKKNTSLISQNQSKEQKKPFDSFSFSQDQLMLSNYLPKQQSDCYQSDSQYQIYSDNSQPQKQISNISRRKYRDTDYLKFLKLKKKLLQDKLKKKIYKAKSRKH